MTKSMLEQAKELLELAKSEEKLEKAKFDTGQKGVHQPMHPESGMSQAGFKTAIAHGDKTDKVRGDNDKNFQSKVIGEAKKEHKKVLSQIKAMPKPNLGKEEENIKGVHRNVVSQDALHNYGESDAGRNTKAAQKANKIGLYNHGVNLKETSKRFHNSILNEMKRMPKPNLGKEELDKTAPHTGGIGYRIPKAKYSEQDHVGDIKGIHKPKTNFAGHEHDKSIKNKGTSVAGHLHNIQGKKERAKEIHKEKLQELKSMSKPKLDKFEKSMLDDKLTKSVRLSNRVNFKPKLPASSEEIKNKPSGHEKGVHRNFDEKGQFHTTAAGSSHAGSAVGMANAIKEGKAFAGSTHNPIPKDSSLHGESIGHAKNWHRKVLNELRSMKKPVLKAEDKSKMSGWSGIIRTDTEANQNQKGVHQHGYKGSSGGISEAGANLRDVRSSSGSTKKKYESNVKEHHKQTLAELKAMPKPNLGKEELCKKCAKSKCICDTKKAEHQPHPGPSISEHQKIFDQKEQSKEESKLKTPEGEAERQKRNKEAFKKAIAEDYKPRFKKECK